MKNIMTILFFILVTLLATNAQNVYIPDTNFKNALIDKGIDTNNDGEIQVSEAEAVTSLNVVGYEISDLTGINSFSNINQLICFSNKISSLNLQGLHKLNWLSCSYNKLSSLNLQGLHNLKILVCEYNQISSINLQELDNLEKLLCSHNQLTKLVLKGLDHLNQIFCGYNQLTNIELNLQNLAWLNCENNQITNLYLQGISNLQGLFCNNNQLTNLNFHGLSNLEDISCTYNKLTSLNLQGLPSLKYLYCSDNQITCFTTFPSSIQSINISNNPTTCLPNYIPVMDALTKALPLCLANDPVNNPNNCENIVSVPENIIFSPNPIHDYADISIEGLDGRAATFEVMDLLGKKVFEKTVTQSFQWHRQHLASGIYLFRLSRDGKLLDKGKIIIQ